ncbi:isochorismatase family cysteine hydrolase [Longispora sp. K20-0274]|uniref:isochorismatase family protein n=1 Tax=Longispora sp. K20-0274 TaxID=3088255 RepID=UPI003999D75B
MAEWTVGRVGTFDGRVGTFVGRVVVGVGCWGVESGARVHDWRIEDREYARQEERRGRRHAYERIDPARTALVVIDMVPFFVAESAYCQGIVPRISLLADALRGAGGTVAWVLPGSDGPPGVADEFYGPRIAELFRRSGGEGPLVDRIWPAFDVRSEDVLVEKTAASAFFPGRCPLPEELAARGIDTVLITGTVTNVCCESSARDASTLGYRVVMVADGNAARRDEDHNATLHTVYRSFGDVRPTAEILELIAGR